MLFQIRLADTGHSEKLQMDKMARGEQLINHISSSYSISPRDQFLLTKIGHAITPQDVLGKVLTEQKADKTLVSRDYKEGLKQGAEVHQDKISCIYVFNVKELKQPIEKIQPKSSQYWKKELKKNVECLSVLRPQIPTYSFNLADFFPSTLHQARPEIFKKVEQITKAINTLQYSWSELSEIDNKIDQVVELCENQRKSLPCLAKKIEAMTKELSKRATQTMKLVQQLKNPTAIDDKSLRQNSGCFQNRKKQEQNALGFESKLIEFKKKTEQRINLLKGELKQMKAPFRYFDKKSIQFANKNFSTEISQKLNEERHKYDNILEMLKKYEQTQDVKVVYSVQNEIKLLEKMLQEKAEKTYYEIYQSLAEYFREFSQLHLQHKNYIKEAYQLYMKWKKFIDEGHQYLSNEEQSISQEISKIPAKMSREPSFIAKSSESEEVSFLNFSENGESFKKSIKNDQQTKRRVQFYKRINFIQKYLQSLCAAEEQCRKKFVKDNGSVKQKLLKNCNVPSLEIDYEGTTDIELFKSNKLLSTLESSSELTIGQFLITEYAFILEKVKNVVGKQNSGKIQNMQEIIKSMSQIFMKVYASRQQQRLKEIDELNNKLEEAEKSITKFNQSMAESDHKILNYEKEIKYKDELLAALERSKADELTKEKNKYDKVASIKKDLEAKLKTQIELNEDLYNTVNGQDEEMRIIKQSYEEIKILLAQKEVIIIRMEKQLAEQHKSNETIPADSLGQSELKSVVLQNFRKEEEYLKLNQEITRLAQQVEVLQNHNQELEAENRELNGQLLKIISTPSEEVEIQTEQPVLFKKEETEGITIGEEIQVGQKALFMPFSSNTYVGVHHKDEERTICNMNSLQQSNYLLDLQSYDQKVYNLLNECSFVVVVQVSDMRKEGGNMRVRGQIRHLLGFEEDSLGIKDYAGLLRN